MKDWWSIYPIVDPGFADIDGWSQSAFSSAAEASLAQFATLGAYSLKPGARDPSVTSNRAIYILL